MLRQFAVGLYRKVLLGDSFLINHPQYYPPASKARREKANATERKNLHTPVYGVKEFVCLSVTNFDPNYLRTGKTEQSVTHNELLHTLKIYIVLVHLLVLVNNL